MFAGRVVLLSQHESPMSVKLPSPKFTLTVPLGPMSTELSLFSLPIETVPEVRSVLTVGYSSSLMASEPKTISERSV